MSDAKRLNFILAATAAVILTVSFGALAYTFIPEGNPDLVTICGTYYFWAEIFENWDSRAFTANDVTYEGVPLNAFLLDSGLQNPESHTYRLTGQDHYHQDVTWNDIQNGYLTLDKHRAVFPGLSQSFWVRDLASIEVI